jgi:hypothetical protein
VSSGTAKGEDGELITLEDIDFYSLIIEAKYLGVAPWELAEQHPIWRIWAGWSMEADQAERPGSKNKRK